MLISHTLLMSSCIPKHLSLLFIITSLMYFSPMYSSFSFLAKYWLSHSLNIPSFHFVVHYHHMQPLYKERRFSITHRRKDLTQKWMPFLSAYIYSIHTESVVRIHTDDNILYYDCMQILHRRKVPLYISVKDQLMKDLENCFKKKREG